MTDEDDSMKLTIAEEAAERELETPVSLPYRK